MTEGTIALRDFAGTVVVTSEERKLELIAAGQKITQVTTTAQQDEALAALRDLKSLRTETEATRKAIKAPVIALGKKIDDIAETFISPADKEEKRLQGLINHFQVLEDRKRQEAELAAEKERQRIENERLETERIAQEAERARLAAEAKALEAESLKGKSKLAAQAEAARLEAESIRLNEQAMAKELEAEDAPEPVTYPVEISRGVSSKHINTFKLIGFTDVERKASLGKLFNAHPELFSFTGKDETPRSYSISLKILDLMERINGKLVPEITSAPGINIIGELKVNIR